MGIHLNSMKIWWFSLSPLVGCRLSPSFLVSFAHTQYTSISGREEDAGRKWKKEKYEKNKRWNTDRHKIVAGNMTREIFFLPARTRMWMWGIHYFINIPNFKSTHSAHTHIYSLPLLSYRVVDEGMRIYDAYHLPKENDKHFSSIDSSLDLHRI